MKLNVQYLRPRIFSIFSEKTWSYPVLLTLLSFALFGNTFWNEFTYDDYAVVVDNPDIRYWHFWDLWGLWGRSTRTLTLMVDYYIFGESSYGYHFQNILWHLFSVVLLYITSVKLSGDSFFSFWGAIFFAVHPIHVEAVTNISTRKEAICMTFSLLSFISYINFIEKDKNWKWFAATIVSWYIALNSKQVSIVLPLSALAYEYIFLSKEKRFLTRKPYLLVTLLLFGIFLFYWFVLSAMSFSKGGYVGDMSLSSALIYSSDIFLRYLMLMLFPFNLSTDHVVSFADLGLSVTSWFFAVALVLFPFFLIRRNPLVVFGLLWFLVHYLPISNVIPKAYFFAERYMYIPSAGLCLTIAFSGKSFFQQPSCHRSTKKVVTVLAIIVLILYSVRTVRYNSVWKNNEYLWEYTIKVSPNSFVAHNNLGNLYNNRGDFSRAVRHLGEALRLNPYYAPAYNNRGNSYFNMNDYGAAIKEYKMAIKFDTGFTYAYFNLGNVYNNLGEYKKAIECLDKAIETQSSFTDAYNNRGIAYEKLGAFQAATDNYIKAVQLDSNYAQAYYNLGRLYSKTGQDDKALSYFQKSANLGFEEANNVLSGLK